MISEKGKAERGPNAEEQEKQNLCVENGKYTNKSEENDRN